MVPAALRPAGGVRLLHSADWQLGMRRRYLDADAQARFADARVDAVRRLGAVAREHGCDALIVAGDVFETNLVDPRTVARACDALATIGVPVLLLPGNHDPLDATAVWRRADFVDACPANVRVLDGASPVTLMPGVEVVAAPWWTKRPDGDLAAAALAAVDPDPGTVRVLVAHGGVDALAPRGADRARISLAGLEAAVTDGRVQYVALGDRHSTTALGRTGRIWYAGAPEPTDFDEVRPGRALVVDLAPNACEVTEVDIGRWAFRRLDVVVAPEAPAADLAAALERCGAGGTVPDHRRTVVRLSLTGTVTLRGRVELDEALDAARDRFAAVDVAADGDLAVLPDDVDTGELALAGFAQDALLRLVSEAEQRRPAARDALALLYRLARHAGAA